MTTLAHRFRSAAHRADLADLAAPRRYPLLRWFALASAAAILSVLVAAALFLGRFVERTSLERDAEAITQLIRSIVEVEGAQGYFVDGGVDRNGDFAEFLAHLGRLPGVLRANVYGRDRRVLWSSDPALTGERFADNDELEAAFGGTAVVSPGTVGAAADKAEHARLGQPGERFVENYLPVWAPNERKVIGVLEVYRTPVDLFAAIRSSQQRIWWAGLAAAALLYLLLFVIVARAARVIARQQAALVEAERLAITGEMASAVAHGLRNPLASIRSTAELGLEIEPAGEVRDLLGEVVVQADRLEGWIRQFLTTVRAGPQAGSAADVRTAVEECVAEFRPMLKRQAAKIEVVLPADLPRVRFCPVLLGQVFRSILANALEALDGGGRIGISAWAHGRRVSVEFADDGPGMTAAEIKAALSPFATTKPAGLGLGLPLAREALERQGGRLAIRSLPGEGTAIRLTLPAARGAAR